MIKSDLDISNFPNLSRISINTSSFGNLNSLKICNNRHLTTIDIADGEQFNINNQKAFRGSLSFVKRVMIDSIPC